MFSRDIQCRERQNSYAALRSFTALKVDAGNGAGNERNVNDLFFQKNIESFHDHVFDIIEGVNTRLFWFVCSGVFMRVYFIFYSMKPCSRLWIFLLLVNLIVV